jgi:hypothetical protein
MPTGPTLYETNAFGFPDLKAAVYALYTSGLLKTAPSIHHAEIKLPYRTDH